MKITVNDRIKLRRKELGLDADFIANKLNISRATYYRYESKEISKIPISALVPLAEVLHTTPEYLMGWSNTKESLSSKELLLLKKYRQLDEERQERIEIMIDVELNQQTQKEENSNVG